MAITISKDQTYTLDGVTYTAISDVVLNTGDDEKVSGLASGSVAAVISGATNSPTITFDATDGAIDFAATGDDTLNITLAGRVFKFIEGTATISGDKVETGAAKFSTSGTYSRADYQFTIEDSGEFSVTTDSFTITAEKFSVAVSAGSTTLNFGVSGTAIRDFTNHTFSLAEGTTVSTNIGDYTISATPKDVMGGAITFTSNGVTFSPNENEGALGISISRNGTPVFANELSITGGSVFVDIANNKIGVTEGTTINTTIGYYVLTASTTDTATTAVVLTENGVSFTPGTDDGALNIVLYKDGTPVFNGALNITDGTISFDATTQKMTFTKGTKIQLGIGNNELGIEVVGGDAASTIFLTENGFLITPDTGDGTLNLTLTGTSSGSLSANIEVLSGGFFLGLDGALTVTEGTELQMDFGDGYIVNFKANDAAGGKISLGADGITFAPNAGDGSLQLAITRDGKTRSASLDVTGSVTYKLDGSISLVQGTVVRNVFEDGNILTITANTAASGSITFNPQDGLTITPTTTDALNVSLTTEDIEIVNVSSIDGTINYSNGLVTVDEGTEAHIAYSFGWELDLRATGGTASIQFNNKKAIYTANEGTTVVLDDNESRIEFENGSCTDVYAENVGDGFLLISEGTTLRSNDKDFVFVLDKAGNYTLNGINVTTSSDNVEVQLTDYNTVTFGQDTTINIATTLSGSDLDVTAKATQGKASVTVDDDGNITYDATDATLQVTIGLEEIIGKSILPNTFTISGGSVTVGATDADGLKSISIKAGTELSFTQNGMTFKGVVQNDIDGRLWLRDGVVLYLHSYEDAIFDTTILNNDNKIFNGMITISGAFSYSAERGTVGSVDSGTYNVHDSSIQFAVGNQSLKLTTAGDTFFAVLNVDNDSGKITFDFNNEKYSTMLISAGVGGNDIFNATLTVNGSIVVDPAAQEIALPKDTALTLTQGDKVMTITALEDAGGKFSFLENGISFAPNEGDGALELNFVTSGRKATLNVSGAVIFGNDGKISLEDGTEVNFDWEDGANLKLTSHGSTGSIAFGEKGIQITSDNENLDLELSMAYGYSTKVSGLKGSLWYNAGKVILDEGTSLTGTGTLGGQVVTVTVETQGGDAYLDFSTTEGFVYGAGTGALKVTYALGELASTFTVNSGSVLIGHNIFQIAEGTDFATDLKDFISALSFTTSEAGTYTINGQTITTTAENISMTATDDYISLAASDGVVTYDDMTFAGAGNVSLSSGGVVLGAGVAVTGFGSDKSFLLAEAGNVTADTGIFELKEDVQTGITVTGTQDGFTFSRPNTEESVLIGGDTSIDFVTSENGTELFNVSDGALLIGMGGVSKVHTDTEGVFTFGNGENDTLAVTVQGDNNVTFGLDDTQFVEGISNIEGDLLFSETNAHLTINGISSAFNGEFSSIGAYDNLLYIHDVTDGSELETFDEDKVWSQLRGGSFTLNDNDLTLTNDADGVWIRNKEIVGLDEGASLQVGEAGNYSVNETALSAKADDIIVGLKSSAYIYDPNNPLITGNTPIEEIISIMTGGDSSNVTVASGREDISLSGGGLAIVEDTGAKVNITASKGNDTIVSKGKNVSIKLNSTGKTDLFALEGKMTLEGYNAATGTGFGTNYGDIFTAIDNGAIDFDKGTLTIDSAVAYFENDSEIIDFYDADGDLQKVGYISGDDAINLSKEKADLILFTEENSTVTGGAGNDSIFAYAGSHVDGGAGRNYIEIEPASNSNAAGAVISVTNGKNTIVNFNDGFDYESDKLFVGVNDTVDFKFDGTDLKVKVNNTTRGVVSNISDGSPFVNFLLEDATGSSKIVAIQKGETVAVEDEVIDYYRGNKSGVDFSNYDGALAINLGSEEESIGTGEVLFDGINQITVGGGLNTISGSSANETLTGNSDGITEFGFGAGGGRDVINNFNFDEDKINVGDAVTGVRINSAGGVRLQVGGGDDYLTINDAQGKKFKINDVVALVDKNIIYDEAANYFVATARNATMTVNESAEIWLDGSHGKNFVGVKVLDASNAEGNTSLVGNDSDNTILAGNGDASLWGGNGGNDLLIGGAGENTFFYTDGNDSINNTNDGDKIILASVAFENIIGADFTDSAVAVKLSDGGQLTVNEAGKAVDFVVGEQTFRVNENHNGFIIKN